MLAQTLNAGEGRSAAAAVGGGRADGIRGRACHLRQCRFLIVVAATSRAR